jgi:D-glycero-alpha-D-manno-heptose-7-phosphate kinase
MRDAGAPLRVVNAAAPIRVCDVGGWTDTWFAGHGKVFNIGVDPCVEVRVALQPIGVLPNRVVLDVESYGDRYGFEPGDAPGRHPLLETAVEEIGVPDVVSVEIAISSAVPAGCATGTSAAVLVALVGALDSLTPGRMTPHEVAYAAHRVETERLGMQSGIQDHLCAAYGRINLIDVFSYPRASVSSVAVPDAVWADLERRLVLLFLGRPHVSSEVHERVITALAREGETSVHLEALRAYAERARDAVHAHDLAALGRVMTANTDTQRQLHADLVCAEAEAAIDVAAARGALGWKVNGAGGEGGSLTFLCGPGARAKGEVQRALTEADPRFRIIPTRLSRHGLRVWWSPEE